MTLDAASPKIIVTIESGNYNGTLASALVYAQTTKTTIANSTKTMRLLDRLPLSSLKKLSITTPIH